MQNSKNDTKATSLHNKLSGINGETATDDEMMEVCKEFEAYLVEKVFDQMPVIIEGRTLVPMRGIF